MTHTDTTPRTQTTVSEHAWGWGEAFNIHLAVLLAAFFVQWALTQKGGMAVRFPWNWIAVLGLAVPAGVAGAVFRGPFMRWMSGAKFAICAIAFTSVLSLLGTFIPADLAAHVTPVTAGVKHNAPALGMIQMKLVNAAHMLGFLHVFTSVPFLAMAMMMLVNLSAVLGRRLTAPRFPQLSFILNHVGILLVIIGLVAGSAQLIQGTVVNSRPV